MCFAILEVKAQLAADFTADVTSGCSPIRVVFADASAGNPTNWKWDLGNGTIAENTSAPSTTYFTPGSYSVKLTVFNGADSAIIVKTGFINVYANPVVDFSANQLSGCVPVAIKFTDKSISGAPGITNYQWDFGDGNISTQQNPLHTYNSPGSFKVTLIVKSSQNCSAQFSRFAYIKTFDSVRANFGIKAPATCSVPAVYSFTDSSNGTINGWQWNFGDGGTSIQKNPTHTYFGSGPFTVSLVVRNGNGCTDTIVKTDAVKPGLLAADFDLPATACVGKPVFFTNNTQPASVLDSSLWTFGDGKSSNLNNTFHAFANAGSYNVRLIAFYDKCSDTITKLVKVQPLPAVSFTGSPLGTCLPPLTVNFTNTTVNGTVVKWDFGDGQTSTLDNPTVTYNNYGSYDVTLIAKNPGGCFDTLVKKAFVNVQQPQINGVNSLPSEGCAPFTASFTPVINSPEPVISYNWNFGNGNTSTANNPSNIYKDSGTYNVRLIIKTISGCSDTFHSVVKAGVKPVAKFSGGPNFICPETPVVFNNLSSPFANEWLWYFGDGTTSEEANPSHLYRDTGWMTVSLITYNNGCRDSVSIKDFLYVNPPIANFTDSFVCADKFTYFFNDASIGGESWKWNFDQLNTAVGQQVSYTFPDTGSYTITLTVQDSSCVNKSVKVIRIINPKANFQLSDSAICGVAYKKFVANGPLLNLPDISKYEWLYGDGKSDTTATNETAHTYTRSGLVMARLVITDINGCKDSVEQPLQIALYKPAADFTPITNNVCAGSSVTFTDASVSVTPIVSWRWTFGNGVDSVFTGAPFTTVYNDPGTYDVKLMVTDSAGCRTAILRKKAVVAFKPVASFFSTDTLICAGAKALFTNLSAGNALKYWWFFGDGKNSRLQNPVNKYDRIGVYSVTLIVADSLNCRDSLIRPNYITVAQTKADFSVSDSFTTCPPLVVNFTNNSINSLGNKWTFGNGNSSSLISPTHTYINSGIFDVQLIAIGNGGCSDTATRKIKILGPSGTFTYQPLGGCPPLIVNFAAKTTNTTNITWDFSDGQSTVTSDTIVAHKYRIPGFYVPKAILSDNLGCKVPVQGNDTIKVVGATALISSIAQLAYCDSAIIQFKDSTISTDPIKTYTWDFGDGTTSNLKNPVHVYNKPGKYTPIFKVETVVGCVASDTLQEPIILVSTPKLSIGSDSSVCIPAIVQYYGVWINSDTSMVNWTWNFGDGMGSGKLVPDPVSYVTPGRRNVWLVGTNFYGCADTAQKMLVANDSPRVRADAFTNICLGQKATLQAGGAKTYSWDVNTSLSCLNCQTTIASPLVNQTYRVVGTDSNGCRSSDTVSVEVKQPVMLTVEKGDTLCTGQQVSLQASNKELYLWSPAAGLNSATVPNPVANPQTTTRYRVIGTDSLNCFPDTGYVDVIVYPIPQYNIIEDKITAVFGTTVPVQTTSSPDIISWRWSPPVGLSCTNCAAPNVTVNNTITYIVSAQNAGGCTATDRVTVVPVCDQNNVFIPNTFSPNNDGNNDVFYPRGRGILFVKSMKIFNRWGELLLDKKDFAVNDPSAGWDGTYRGARLTPDVYVYVIELICDGKNVLSYKGDITLLR
jgi:gliding motility-associated-like protein